MEPSSGVHTTVGTLPILGPAGAASGLLPAGPLAGAGVGEGDVPGPLPGGGPCWARQLLHASRHSARRSGAARRVARGACVVPGRCVITARAPR
jgi:hypothetical protein